MDKLVNKWSFVSSEICRVTKETDEPLLVIYYEGFVEEMAFCLYFFILYERF